jgi:hypothetical protein
VLKTSQVENAEHRAAAGADLGLDLGLGLGFVQSLGICCDNPLSFFSH